MQSKTKTKNKSIMGWAIFAIICITVTVIAIMCARGCSNSTNPTVTDSYNGVKWDGEKHGELNSNSNYAYIPGFTKLTFKSETVWQNVNFYNPEQNMANANLTLKLSDDTVLWEEKNVRPGYGFYNIELSKTLKKGNYDASLVYDFASDAGEKYNGGIVPFKLIVE